MKTHEFKPGDKVKIIGSNNCWHNIKEGSTATIVEVYETLSSSGQIRYECFGKSKCGKYELYQTIWQHDIEPITPAPKRANTNQKSNKMTQTETGKFQTRITDEKTLTRYQKFMKRNKIATRSQLVAEALREYVRNNS